MAPVSRRTSSRGRTGRPDFGVLIALGLGGGVALGAAFGAAALGMALGLIVAVVLNAWFEWREGAPGGRTALGISTVGAAVVVAVLLWS